mgnify:FL=1
MLDTTDHIMHMHEHSMNANVSMDIMFSCNAKL